MNKNNTKIEQNNYQARKSHYEALRKVMFNFKQEFLQKTIRCNRDLSVTMRG